MMNLGIAALNVLLCYVVVLANTHHIPVMFVAGLIHKIVLI